MRTCNWPLGRTKLSRTILSLTEKVPLVLTVVRLEAAAAVTKPMRTLRFEISAPKIAACFLFAGILFSGLSLMAQSENSSYRMSANKSDIEIDLLGNYYSQDGEYGSPQGGVGTEELNNIASLLVVKIPVDSNSSIQVQGGADYYSSASTDRIDYQLSTESSSDLRSYGTVTWTERDLGGGRTYSASAGVSIEYDYESLNGALSFSQEWDRGASELSFGLRGFFDNWDFIVPLELSTREYNIDTKRRSFGFSAVYSRIINTRLQAAFTAEVNYMEGLLSTPFHRIYYVGAPDNAYELFVPADEIERLPGQRVKFPISARLNWMMNDVLSLRTFARYYVDSWGVSGITGDFELSYDLNPSWTVMSGFRYYDQQASDYYFPFATATASDEFVTSDIDLSELSMTKLSVGLRYQPIVGIGRAKLGKYGLEWRHLSLRGAYYERNPGLTGFSATLSTGVVLRNKK